MPPSPSDPADDLQFQTAEPASTIAARSVVRQSCIVCKRPIQSVYFAVGGKILCPGCANMVRSGPPGNAVARFFKAFAFGSAAAIAGAVVWGAMLYYTHYQIGYVALLVGYMVGKSVRKGSGGRGGIAYQIMAVLLTYMVAAAAEFPTIFELSQRSHGSGIENIVVSAITSAIAPVLVGKSNPIILFIYGIALWEAWKFTRYIPIPLAGPYQIALTGPQPVPSATLSGDTTPGEII